nr:receptor-like cytosolic serine/threonine-protein kinase rbk2 [Quercus suber]
MHRIGHGEGKVVGIGWEANTSLGRRPQAGFSDSFSSHDMEGGMYESSPRGVLEGSSRSLESETASPGASTSDSEELEAATNNFSHDNLIGEGGYAKVYKGALEDGQLVAIKRLTRGTQEEMTADFLSELGVIVHVELMSLLFCQEIFEKERNSFGFLKGE